MDAKQFKAIVTDPAAFQSEITVPSLYGPTRFGYILADFQKERFAQINPALISIANGIKPECGRYFWEATKGASKDSDLAVCLLWLLAVSGRPLTCQVGAADLDQAGELRKAAKDILHLNPWLANRIDIKNWKIICKATGGECEIVAADIAGSHGARPDVLILNELSHVTKQEFAENLMDNAAKIPGGLVAIATNAGFTNTWQFRWRELARTSDRWIFNKVDYPSPWLDPEEIAEAKIRNSASRFQRLFHGVWASGSGDALDPEDIAAAVDPSISPLRGNIDNAPNDPRIDDLPYLGLRQTQSNNNENYYSFVAGLDLGIRHDHSALCVLAADSRTQRIRLAESRSWAPPKGGKVNLEKVERAVLESHRRFDLLACLYDPFQAELLAQRLTRKGVRMIEQTFTGKNLDKMASTLLDVFRSRRIDLYNDKRLIEDLSRLTIVEKSYGYKLESTRTDSGHCDLATAMAIALPYAVDLTQNSRTFHVKSFDLYTNPPKYSF